jgi:hypothetical protein
MQVATGRRKQQLAQLTASSTPVRRLDRSGSRLASVARRSSSVNLTTDAQRGEIMMSIKASLSRLLPVVATSIVSIGAPLVVRADVTSFDSLALAQDKPGGAAAQERIAALKQSLAQSQQRLRQYEWIETTVVSLKGEEKSRKQLRCYYGADGKVEKLPVSAPAAPAAAPAGGGGRRGGRLKQTVVANKKEELSDYMERAVALVHRYVPPNPDDIDRAKTAGNVAVHPQQAGQVSLELTSYIKPADKMTIGIDTAANRLTALNVASYLDEPKDAVTLAVQFAALDDGTSYTAQTTLDATAKNVRVVIQNSGYRPLQK